MINGEILRPSLYRRFHFADDQRWDIDAYFIQTVSLRWWSTARYYVLHYADGFTSPMINGEILRPSLYRRYHFADDQRWDIAFFFIQTVSLRRWSTARYRCLLYTDGFTSPIINGEILRPSLCRRFHFADDQRRDIASFIMQTVSLRRWSTARYCDLLNIQTVSLRRWSTVSFPICVMLRIFNQTDCDIHMKKAVLYIETIT